MLRFADQEVKIYAGYNVYRYSFHIQGLLRLFGSGQLKFTAKGFPAFHQHALPFIVGQKPGLKIYISAGDGPGYNEEGLAWSDLYVKRTLLTEDVPETYRAKIIPMGPHFGLRVWGVLPGLFQALRTYMVTPPGILNLRQHLLNYLKQTYERHPEQSFIPGQSRSDYIFYASTLYPTHPGYNHFRATFIEACQAMPGVQFEGGLVRKDDFRVPEYEAITINTYYRPAHWLSNVKASAMGFWAPGDQGAMTLKLGEFLACGKAIICVPIRQEQLPAPLVHGEHVHFVDGSLDEMKAAVRLLCTDHDYRSYLEQNARSYYEKYVAPHKAIQRFIEAASERIGIPCS